MGVWKIAHNGQYLVLINWSEVDICSVHFLWLKICFLYDNLILKLIHK